MDHPGGPMCGGSTPWQEGPQDEVTMTKARREALELIQKMLQARKDALVYCINDKKRELHACHYALETMKRERAELQEAAARTWREAQQ